MKQEAWEGQFSPETEEGIRKVLKMGEEMKKGINTSKWNDFKKIRPEQYRPVLIVCDSPWPLEIGFFETGHGMITLYGRRTINYYKYWQYIEMPEIKEEK